MGIIKSFKGAGIRKPGSYSFSQVSQAGGAPLGANGTLLIVGEADSGAPGSQVGIVSYSASQLGALIQNFVSGPIVDCARAAISPSKTPGVQGCDQILIWKTNASTQASQTLQAGGSNLLQLLSNNWGLPGNAVTVAIANGSNAATQRLITVKSGSLTESLPQNPGIAQISIQYTGAGTASTATITGATDAAKTLTTTCTGATADNLSIALAGLSMNDLVNAINAAAPGKYTVSLLNTQSGRVKPATDLDCIIAQDIKTAAVSLYRLQQELVETVNQNSQLITAKKLVSNVAGIPAAQSATANSGGIKGASANSDFSTGLANTLGLDWGVVVCAVSRDATADISDAMTDPGSSYTLASVEAAVVSHLILRGNIKNRREAQGMGGRRAATKASVYAAAQGLSSELYQMCMQDVLVLDQNANLVWKQPHVMAAMMAGIRLGTPIGEPLTYKFLNCSGVGHSVSWTTGISAGDFDPAVDFDPAIDSGITFVEKAAGGFRIVVDNTTYGADQSFVYNRGSVVEAAQYIAKTLRQTAELVFVGKKVSNGAAKSIRSVLASKLLELNQANITTASADAPFGYVDRTFVVTIQGNTASVNIEVKPVQALDFILINFTLGDIQQSA